ncbi:MAG TPA: hypothetical protein VII40_18765 [Xanthobacteraceae bacterium]
MAWWLSFSELFRTFGLILGGGLGIYIAWRRAVAATRQADATLRQAELARRDHVAELFNRAVGQLTDEKLEIRLGAIYTLRQIARDFPDLAKPTLELLSTYLRERAGSYGEGEPPVDVREIINTLRNYLVRQ